jgi:hypothetical protein
MEYHEDRFNDFSLMIYRDKKLVGVFPANITNDNKFISHQGLTFGGIYTKKENTSVQNIEIIGHLVKHLYFHDIPELLIKMPPKIYGTLPDDDFYLAFQIMEAKITRLDTTIAIDYNSPLPYQTRRKRSIKKASKNNVKIEISQNFKPFWDQILTPNLFDRFGVKPVHSLTEIGSLQVKNNDEILQFDAYIDGEIEAGCTMFLSNHVAHAQYISGSQLGRSTGVLDYLFDEIIKYYATKVNFFNFGIANENNGLSLNKGLLEWKEGFGARSYSQPFINIETCNYNLLFSSIN